MGLIADFKKTIEGFATENFHKQKYRVFIPTPPHTETVHLDPIRESDTYGGWRKWMEDCKGCDDKKLKDWLDGIIKPYHESVYNCIDAAKKNLESKDTTVKTKDEYKKGILAKIDKDEQADLDAMNKKYDDLIAAQDKIIDDSNAKKSTVGSVYKEEEEKEKVEKAEEKKAEIEEDRADEEEDIKEKYQDQRDDADDKAEDMVEDAEERKEKIEDQIKEIDDFKKDHSDITAGKGDLKPIFEFKHTSKFAEQIYSGYVPLVDKYSGELSPDLYTGSQIVVDTTSDDASLGEQTTGSTELMTEEAWRFAYKHDKKHHDREITKWEWESETQQGVVGYDFNEETGEETEVMGDVQVRVLKSKNEKIECPPWCEENDLEIRPALDVEVSYSEKKGNRFSYKVKQQADKDSEYYQYFWFINDNATDSLAYRSDISIQRAGLSKASTVNDAGQAGGGDSSVADDPFVKLVNAIPSIKVVEFQPVINIAELINNVTSIFGMGAALGEAAADLLSGGKDHRIEEATQKFFDKCTAFGKGSVIDNIYKQFGNLPFGVPSAEFLGLFDFPYIMYRYALRYTVLNTYEFPYFGNNYMVGRGSQGWRDSTLANMMPGGMLGDIAKNLNVNITTRPMFSLDGNGEPYPAVEFELNLFNYNLQALVHNFLFVNTLVPNNMWLLRGMFQQGGCLYDIQIPGRIRFFCCKADISVEHAGITRVPPKEFFDLLDLHIGKMEDEYVMTRDKYEAIRVPDVYKVKISFQSLIPNNYNTYLFTYFESDRIEENTELTIKDGTVSESVVDSISKGIQKTYDETIGEAKKIIEAENEAKKKLLEKAASLPASNTNLTK